MATDYRSDVVALALSYVNVIGGKAKGDDEFITYYNQIAGTDFDVDNTPWCAIFVTYCMRKAGVPLNICPNFAGCNNIKKTFLEPNNLWKPRGTYMPLPADLIFFNWDEKDSDLNHVGIVVKADNSRVYAILGNSMNGVRHKAYPLISKYIVGYGALKYDNISTPTPPPEPQVTTDASEPIQDEPTERAIPRPSQYSMYVKSFQQWLNKTYKMNISVDGACKRKTKRAVVKALQTHLNTTYHTELKTDGRYGPDTIAAIREYGTLYPGARGNMVYMVQGLLYGAGFSAGGLDGAYGPLMKTAVSSYQLRNHIPVDGVVGPNTWSCLVR